MTQLVVITFLDKHKHLHPVTFALYDSSLAKRWKKLIEDNISRPDHHYHTSFVNKTFDNLPEIIQDTNNTISLINKEYDKILPEFDSIDILDHTVLNSLHKEYEIYGDRIDILIADGRYLETLHNNFLKLNELIHVCEEIVHAQDIEFPAMSVLFDIYPQQLYDAILEKDKLYLTSTFNWGRLYIGYNTLGKDWLEISHHNDTEVITRGQVRPQERFSAEAWINFSPDDDINFTKSQFEKWYDSLPDDLQQQVPINNLNELCLGRFEIGSVVFDDYFTKYNTINNWKSQNHKCKSDWNNNMFSTFTNIVSIEFRDVL
jgi:hypothetical protein